MMEEKKCYSQVGQDLFVLSMFDKDFKGFFVDIGCQDPFFINNTYLLEQRGWDGLSFDIVDYSKEWQERKTPFVCTDVLRLKDYWLIHLPQLVDYLSLDISPFAGARYKVLKTLLELGVEFKVITVEHDVWREECHDEFERLPQRALLTKFGYFLINPDVNAGGNSFEDWWVNPKYISIG